ncbi:ATP-binding protein [Herbaspirillum sp. GCM10030257]|uniref:sensor histidine kinase n=1 Tax=Herbaspirillum sp. GCM10030257 TaxID=3273393 RepID=UPI003609BE0A
MNIKKSIYDRGLGAYLALAFSLMTVVLTLILVEVIGVFATQQVKSNIGNGLAELALQTSDKLDRGMYERFREVRLMSLRSDLTSSQVDVAEKRQVLDERQQTYGYYAWIGLTDINGKVLVSTRKMLEGADVSQRPWFRNALQGKNVGDVHEAVLLAKLLPDTNNEPKRFVDVAFPYANRDGQPLGVLGVHLSWQWAREVEQSIMQPLATRRQVEALIVNDSGTILLGPTSLRDTQISMEPYGIASDLSSGFRVLKWSDGREYLVGFSKSQGYADYPGLGWTVLVRQNIDDAYAPVKRIQRRVLWSGIALALLFSLLGWVVARRIAQPMRALADSAQKVQLREATEIAVLDASYSEVHQLTASLNALVDNLLHKEAALKELNQSLEQRVQQRTRELEDALASVRANEARIRTIIETAQDAFVGVDLNGSITDWNSRAEQMFGWTSKEAIGRPLIQLVVPERFRNSYAGAMNIFHRTGEINLLNQRLERLVVNRDGKEFPVEVTIGLAGEKDTAFFSAFLHDISERKKVEQMKNEFISTVSHELRTPLTAIRASLSMLVDGMAGELPADVQGLLDISYKSCERLVRLVNDVLDIEKIESGNMEFHIRKQPLLPVVRHAMETIDAYARQYRVNVQLDADIEMDVPVDHDRMIQVLHNLLSNAIKFSPPEATVQLLIRQMNDRVRLSVIDHGAGIPAKFRNRIFQKFAQADSTDSRQKGGTGLGLSICKSIVEEHGGTISFESEAGQGTVFHVDLPMAV